LARSMMMGISTSVASLILNVTLCFMGGIDTWRC
jgi:hypothetical protein